MFRPVDRPLSFRQRANEWIYKMLFLWSREPVPGPKAGPWFAWFATALVLWRCRRSVTKAILAVSPLRLLKKRNALSSAVSKTSMVTQTKQQPRLKLENPILQRKYKHAIKKVKRYCTGDGPHVNNLSSAIQSQQIHYRVTRSGKIYGKYPHKAATAANNS
ncbi:uncharacterized protein LOC128882167 [Hylaeus volcanicus]|uniref:uncharacterized protein LOC128882167 n=1 Tax=Hylaeus volcanicus TaxID=313075 RepID=UPI0023B7DB1D|nr:uncharacterized protein LOC128882167 [Hylaeus volcanicus]